MVPLLVDCAHTELPFLHTQQRTIVPAHTADCRYQEQSDTLRVDNYKLTEELEEQKSKLKDINEFLVNELKARALSFATLQAELTETKKTMEDNKTHFQVQINVVSTGVARPALSVLSNHQQLLSLCPVGAEAHHRGIREDDS